ncbi:hypothetical protein ONZ45_g16605 [Pleurotus djamor]|nr:hypothetical protein ONZ45_g16605 [Pleurotus djamor]
MGYSERKLLHADELDGLDQTTVFLLQCETIEAVSQVASPSHSGLPTNTSATPTLRNSLSSATPSLIRSLNTTLVPPPTKPVLDPTPDVEIDLRPSSVQTIETKLDTSLLSLDIDPMSGLSEPSVDAQTRFIPSVGWCIRCESRVSQGGRFKIMFLDGATLDINVDEDWAEFMDPSGIVTRYVVTQ